MERRKKILIFAIILLLGELGAITSDIYVPSMPAMTTSLASSDLQTKLTIAFYLAGFGLSQLIYGPLSDYYGRRKIVLSGLIIAIISSAGCTFSPSIGMLLFYRLLQGLGTGSGTVMARAIMRDVFDRKSLLKIGAYYSLISVQIITLIPLLGGYIQETLGWRANFAFILMYSFVALSIIAKKLPETNKRRLRQLKLKKVIGNYWIIMNNRIFLSSVFCSSLTLASLIAYITIGPFLFQDIIGLSPVQYGLLSLVSCFAVITGSLFNSQLGGKIGIKKMLFIGTVLMISGGFLLFLPVLLKSFNLFLILSPVFVFIIGTNLVFICTSVLGLDKVRRLAGSAGAMYGAIQMLISAFISMLVATIPGNTVLPLAIIFSCAALFILIIYYKFLKNSMRRVW